MNTQTRHPLRPDMRTLYILIALNVLVFLMQQSGTLPTEAGALWYPQNEAYVPYQWLSHMFLHADLAHLLLNMYAVGMFGRYVLQVWGEKRFLLLYFLGGLGAAALYLLWVYVKLQTGGSNALAYVHVIGASGAAFAILAAFSTLFPDAPLSLMFVPVAFKAKHFVLGLVAYEAFAEISGVSLFGSNIAHVAHIGGALTGWLLAWWWQTRRTR